MRGSDRHDLPVESGACPPSGSHLWRSDIWPGCSSLPSLAPHLGKSVTRSKDYHTLMSGNARHSYTDTKVANLNSYILFHMPNMLPRKIQVNNCWIHWNSHHHKSNVLQCPQILLHRKIRQIQLIDEFCHYDRPLEIKKKLSILADHIFHRTPNKRLINY